MTNKTNRDRNQEYVDKVANMNAREQREEAARRGTEWASVCFNDLSVWVHGVEFAVRRASEAMKAIDLDWCKEEFEIAATREFDRRNDLRKRYVVNEIRQYAGTNYETRLMVLNPNR